MASNNRGRSTTGKAAVPYYAGSPQREAAKHLRLTVSRFLAERASESEVDEAVRMWGATTSQGTDRIQPVPSADSAGARLTEQQMAEMDKWPRATSDLGRLAETRCRALLDEVRARRAADRGAQDIAALIRLRDRMATSESPGPASAALDCILFAHGAKP
jgi:hypothetical protein